MKQDTNMNIELPLSLTEKEEEICKMSQAIAEWMEPKQVVDLLASVSYARFLVALNGEADSQAVYTQKQIETLLDGILEKAGTPLTITFAKGEAPSKS